MRSLLSIAMLALLTAILAGCGRQGPLEPPPAAQTQPGEDGQSEPAPEKPNRPFILDGLLS